MTTTPAIHTGPSDARPAAARVSVALATIITVIAIGIITLFAPQASASPLTRAGNAVGVIAHAAGQRVGPHEQILAGRGRVRAPNYDQTASASCVGADSAASDAAGTTAHGLTRVAGSAATRGGVLNEAEIAVVRGSGTPYLQSNGAIARVLQQADGRFSVVVDGQGGFITSFKNLSQNSLDRLAKNYGWVQQ